jgi:hypothetical protein
MKTWYSKDVEARGWRSTEPAKKASRRRSQKKVRIVALLPFVDYAAAVLYLTE